MRFKRLIQQIGEDKMNRLRHATVLIVGLGGVGGNAAEAIARSGFGRIVLVDRDVFDITNSNRQLGALDSTMNQRKVDVIARRIHDINPDCAVVSHHLFYNEETKATIWAEPIDYVIDCIDTITYKLDLVRETQARNIPAIHVMGTGNKLRPESLKILSLAATTHDPIARVMRQKLRDTHNLKRIAVVASDEPPISLDPPTSTPSSNAFVPNAAGILAASYIFRIAIDETPPL